MLKLSLFLCSLLVSNILLGQSSNSQNFYASLFRDVDEAKGNIILSFNSGKWSTTHKNGQTAESTLWWEVADNTNGKINFDYSQSAMQKIVLTFSKPLLVSYDNGLICTTLQFDTIEYQNGFPVYQNLRPFEDQDPDECSDLNYYLVYNSLKVPQDLNKIMKGEVFFGVHNSTERDGKWKPLNKSKRKLVKALSFQRENDRTPGLLVKLLPNAVINFGLSDNEVSQKIVIDDECLFELDKLYIDFESSAMAGRLRRFSANIKEGTFASSGSKFKITGDSQIKIQNINFESDNLLDVLDVNGGTIEGRLGEGSFIKLQDIDTAAGIKKEKNITFRDGTEILLNSFSMRLEKNRSQTSETIELGGSSSIRIKVRSATLPIGKDGYLILNDGALDLQIQYCKWATNINPTLIADINLIQADIKRGRMFFNRSNKYLEVKNGNVLGTGLTINTNYTPLILGSFIQVNFEIEENSEFGIPNGWQLITKNTGHFDSQDLTLVRGSNYPRGSFKIHLPFRNFYNSNSKEFNINDGDLQAEVTIESDSVTRGRNIFGNGEVIWDTQLSTGTGYIIAKINLKNGFFVSKKDSTYFESILSGDAIHRLETQLTSPYIPPKNEPYYPDYVLENVTFFPTLFSVSVAEESIPIKPFLISFDRGVVQYDFSLDFNTKVSFAQGHGQYEDPFDLNKGYDENEYKNYQEVFTLKAAGKTPFTWDLTCTLHIYAMYEHPFIFATKMHFNSSRNGLQVKLDQFKSLDPLKEDYFWKRDGCKSSPFLEFVGTVFGTLLNHQIPIPGLPIIGAWAGSQFGNELDNRVSAMITARIASSMESELMNKSFTIRK